MKYLVSLIFVLSLFLAPAALFAQDGMTSTAKAEVLSILEEKTYPREERFQVVEVLGLDGVIEGETFTIDSREAYVEELRYLVNKGDRVVLQVVNTVDGDQLIFLTDVVRTKALVWIIILFVLVTLAVGRLRGLASLGGLAITFAVLIGFILPSILAGNSPVLITVIGATIILAVNLYITHGFNRRTTSAFFGTVVGLAIVVVLSEIFVKFASLSGLGTEEAAFLQLQSTAIAFPEGILLAGIVLGAVGALDDVAITQAETVFELKEVNKRMKRKELYSRAMRIGRHHIASIVNTLILAYSGAALPLLLLFLGTNLPIVELLSTEAIAEELVRMLAGTIGLILTVPLATWFASFTATR